MSIVGQHDGEEDPVDPRVLEEARGRAGPCRAASLAGRRASTPRTGRRTRRRARRPTSRSCRARRTWRAGSPSGGATAMRVSEPGPDGLVEVAAAAVVLLQREDHGAHGERHERAIVGSPLRGRLDAPAGRVVVELLPRVAEEPPQRRQDDEQERDRDQRLERGRSRRPPGCGRGHWREHRHSLELAGIRPAD